MLRSPVKGLRNEHPPGPAPWCGMGASTRRRLDRGARWRAEGADGCDRSEWVAVEMDGGRGPIATVGPGVARPTVGGRSWSYLVGGLIVCLPDVTRAAPGPGSLPVRGCLAFVVTLPAAGLSPACPSAYASWRAHAPLPVHDGRRHRRELTNHGGAGLPATASPTTASPCDIDASGPGCARLPPDDQDTRRCSSQFACFSVSGCGQSLLVSNIAKFVVVVSDANAHDRDRDRRAGRTHGRGPAPLVPPIASPLSSLSSSLLP